MTWRTKVLHAFIICTKGLLIGQMRMRDKEAGDKTFAASLQIGEDCTWARLNSRMKDSSKPVGSCKEVIGSQAELRKLIFFSFENLAQKGETMWITWEFATMDLNLLTLNQVVYVWSNAIFIL